jgi:iron complex outermembrane receptor protein
MSSISVRALLALTASTLALTAGVNAWADSAPAAADSNTGAGAEGTEVSAVIVTAEKSKAALMAPAKASIEETQPEAIITHKFIEQATKENGSWVSAASIAPSMSGIGANGGGVGETTKLTLRGFQDGQFNMTYDGIAFGDTNGPTHHEASYWPASTIGAVVIDRGPGAAGDLGPANFGGAIHMFSPEVGATPSASQKLTYGSFDTLQAVTTLNTGTLPQLAGGRLLLNFEERSSKGELSWSGGESQNQLAKFVLPINTDWNFTLFGSHNYTQFHQNDGTGAGETWAQVQAYGKNFALTNIPGDEHYYKYNTQGKQTDFEYADMKGSVMPSLSVEDQLYTYYYKNATFSASSNTDLIGSNASSLIAAKKQAYLPGQAASDLEGYDKLNQYRVWGDIARLNKDFSFGTLKLGGIYEWATTGRHNLLLDITNGWTPDLKFYPANFTSSGNVGNYPGSVLTNAKLLEKSDFQDYQLFADFYWRPIDNLTITPGFKFVHEHLEVRALNENTAGATYIPAPPAPQTPVATKNIQLFDSSNTSSPVYFLTGNYKITPYWSVYGQFATSFLFPDISSLYFVGAATGLQSLQPETTKTYQAGTVYSRGNFTADADVYRVDAANLLQACTYGADAADCNVGSARYTGFEGEAAYAFDFGLSLFANGGSNVAKQLANAANPSAGISANPARELANAPRYTYAVGGVFNHGPWAASLDYKKSGDFATYGANRIDLPGYDTIDASGAYDFGHFKVKLAVFNLADKRAITSYKPTATSTALYQGGSDLSYYEFQAGREIQLTVQAKF